MSIKNPLIRFVGVFAVIMVLSSFGSLHGIAETEARNANNEVVVELNDDFFNPDVITLPNEETTILLLQNKGMKEHTFTVKGLAIDVELQPGEEKKISIKPGKTGTYELICRYHEQEGMVGEVVVE
ncbi:cupredoxin domain-containing protein [Oceanobacillus sp. AG]|uniref:cupredoxin domain-containing protein n=1 Tax=Oceanobacillus sp. AG TaxID=2681969 RepID=UPI0012EB17CE|nr:cupredoxin domain-containing protein [Oceanobacillus sp. AG]